MKESSACLGEAEDQAKAAPVMTDAPTPLLAQYLAIKKEHKDCLLFFRLGDFYELFFDDAVKASRALDIALTRRGQYQGVDVPMCGVPFHAYENYMARLIKQNFRVAICEQTESPEEAKKRGGKSIVTREVVRIVTPGTVTEEGLLESRSANYLACLARVGGDLALAWMDLTSGVPTVEECGASDLSGLLARVDAGEIVVSQKVADDSNLRDAFFADRDRLTCLPDSRFDSANAERFVKQTYRVATLEAFGSFSRVEMTALGALLDYVTLTQKSDLSHLSLPRKSTGRAMAIDAATRRNLELTRTLSNDRSGSLLDAIDRTKTGAGARLLAARLVSPLLDTAAIKDRLDDVTFFVQNKKAADAVRALLASTPDIERALARLALGRGGPRDLASVRDALGKSAEIKRSLAYEMPVGLTQSVSGLGDHSELQDKLLSALAADLPYLARDGGFIARGFSDVLDEQIALRDDGRRLIAGLQQKYADQTGINALKIKHNQIIGYHIEVSALHADKLLEKKDTFIHRQSMVNGARFTTIELSDLAKKIAEAADKAIVYEVQIFESLVKDILSCVEGLRRVAASLAEIDVASSLAALSVEQNYVRPTIDDSLDFSITSGRHPVVEQALKNAGRAFVGNDCDLSAAQRLWLLTGPNMAGKSTYLRQNALIVLMAQMGSYVPAKTAKIGVVDRLFSRVGAADDLARGQSTFMVEMVETAAILNQAGPRALVILDEIGRGTATYDGLSIAWAVVEHLHEENKSRALFATHYHELTQLADRLSSLYCATMRIKEWQKEIIFLHEVAKGTADRSYGVHVAQMAGLPATVIVRANQVLENLETKAVTGVAKPLCELPLFSQLAPVAVAQVQSELQDFVAQLNPDELSPKAALDALYQIKGLVGK